MAIPTGAIRYNTDSNKMECFNGTKWMQVSVSSPDLGKSTNSDIAGGARGIFAGGADPNHSSMIQAFDITTTGDSKDFGDLLYKREHTGAVSNSIRGVWFGGVTPTYQTDIQYCIINTTGSAANWGDLSANIAKGYQSGASDSHGGLL